MKLVSFTHKGSEPQFGVVDGDDAIDVRGEIARQVAGAAAEVGDGEPGGHQRRERLGAQRAGAELLAELDPAVGQRVVGLATPLATLLAYGFEGGHVGLAVVALEVRAEDGVEEGGRQRAFGTRFDQRVEAPAAVAAVTDDAGTAEEGEVVADPGLRQSGDGHQLVDREFFAGEQAQQSEPGGVRQELEGGLEGL